MVIVITTIVINMITIITIVSFPQAGEMQAHVDFRRRAHGPRGWSASI